MPENGRAVDNGRPEIATQIATGQMMTGRYAGG